MPTYDDLHAMWLRLDELEDQADDMAREYALDFPDLSDAMDSLADALARTKDEFQQELDNQYATDAEMDADDEIGTCTWLYDDEVDELYANEGDKPW